MIESADSAGAGADEVPAPSLLEIGRAVIGISLLGFGGPSAHLALMLDELVERREWLARERFVELMAVTNLLPGPNSSEVAIHVGYVLRGWRGALVSGLAFLLPTFVMVTALSAAYFRFGTLPQVEALFWGIQPVIVAIVLSAGVKIARASIRHPWQSGLLVVGAAVSLFSGIAVIIAMLCAGTATAGVGRGSTARSLVVLPILGVSTGGLPLVFLTHLWIGCVLFGGGYVLVALLEPYAVGQYGWLTAEQFLDGVALTQAVPGPISTLSAFVGYAAAGLPGAVLGTLGIYLPAFVAVLVSAPRFETLRENATIRRALEGVVPVAAGAVVGVGVSLVTAGVRDPWAAGLACAALLAAVWRKVPALWLMAAGLFASVVRMLVTLSG